MKARTFGRAVMPMVAVLALTLTGCGSGATTTTADGPDRNGAFVLNEWGITAPNIRLHAGKVRLTVMNIGSETHEMVIVKANDAASLPTKADGSVDEAAIPEADKPGEFPDVGKGSTVTKSMELTAGRYVAMCNLVDAGTGPVGSDMPAIGGEPMMDTPGMAHVHYRLGMVTSFTVS